MKAVTMCKLEGKARGGQRDKYPDDLPARHNRDRNTDLIQFGDRVKLQTMIADGYRNAT